MHRHWKGNLEEPFCSEKDPKELKRWYIAYLPRGGGQSGTHSRHQTHLYEHDGVLIVPAEKVNERSELPSSKIY